MDTIGHMEKHFDDGHWYFLTVVEVYKRYIFASPMSKGKVSDALVYFIMCVEKQSGQVVIAVHADGGGEFKGAKKFPNCQEGRFTTSSSYTHQSIPMTETTDRTVLDFGRA